MATGALGKGSGSSAGSTARVWTEATAGGTAGITAGGTVGGTAAGATVAGSWWRQWSGEAALAVAPAEASRPNGPKAEYLHSKRCNVLAL